MKAAPNAVPKSRQRRLPRAGVFDCLRTRRARNRIGPVIVRWRMAGSRWHWGSIRRSRRERAQGGGRGVRDPGGPVVKHGCVASPGTRQDRVAVGTALPVELGGQVADYAALSEPTDGCVAYV